MTLLLFWVCTFCRMIRNFLSNTLTQTQIAQYLTFKLTKQIWSIKRIIISTNLNSNYQWWMSLNNTVPPSITFSMHVVKFCMPLWKSSLIKHAIPSSDRSSEKNKFRSFSPVNLVVCTKIKPKKVNKAQRTWAKVSTSLTVKTCVCVHAFLTRPAGEARLNSARTLASPKEFNRTHMTGKRRGRMGSMPINCTYNFISLTSKLKNDESQISAGRPCSQISKIKMKLANMSFVNHTEIFFFLFDK